MLTYNLYPEADNPNLWGHAVTRPQWVNGMLIVIFPSYFPCPPQAGIMGGHCEKSGADHPILWRFMTWIMRHLSVNSTAQQLHHDQIQCEPFAYYWHCAVKACKIGGGFNTKYCQTSNISYTLVGNKIVDHSDVVGASPVGAAPTTSSFST